jgi:hypothetical protein
MSLAWKENLETALRHHADWWKHEGLVVVSSALPQCASREVLEDPGDAPDPDFFYTQPGWRARENHFQLARSRFPVDTLPIASVDTGPGSLSLYLNYNCTPGFTWETVWFEPGLACDEPELYGGLRFDPTTRWWHLAEELLRTQTALGQGKYLTGCMDLVENIDIVAALRYPQTLMVDLVDRSAWVEEKVWEVNQAWIEAYERIYALIRDEQGGAAFGAFHLWGPGKTAKVQCDTCAMFSKRMMKRFVIPALTAQCDYLDYSMYHLDGHQCIQHLDLLLDIESLDAIEWTPDPQVPSGGSPRWYELYRRILAAGKSVQAIGVRPEELEPLLEAVGGKGMYIQTSLPDEEAEAWAADLVEQYR